MPTNATVAEVSFPLTVKVDADTLRDALRDTFERDFHLWTVDENGSITSTTGELSPELESIGLSERLDSAPPPSTLALVNLDENSTAVVARPGNTDTDPRLVIGVVPGSEPALIERLVSASCVVAEQRMQMSQMQVELSACLEQLTYDLEEQTWLRTLSQQMQLCDVRRDSLDLAAELLPSLRELVFAESISFLREADNQFLDTGIEVAGCLHYGRAIVPDSFWSRWLNRHSDDVVPGPRIMNGRHVDTELAEFGVRSYILVRVGIGEGQCGWLIALNRLAYRTSSGAAPAVSPEALSELEFGTVEAGLLEAAASMLATHAQNASILKSREELVVGVIRAMSAAIDARDPYTRGHSQRVGGLARRIAYQLGIEEGQCDRIYLSGLLHDVGKIGVRDRVLLKPGKLNADELAEMNRHPEIGHRIVSRLGELEDLLPGILHHHEAVDGSGYPHGLVGERIPLMARIIAVADTYDAMTSDRPYRTGMSTEKAIQIMQERAGIQWDARVVTAFLRALQYNEPEDRQNPYDSHIGLNAAACSLATFTPRSLESAGSADSIH